MKFAIAFVAGFVTGLAIYRAPRYTIFNDKPPTPRDWKPRMRHWVNGEEVT